MGVLNLTPDSFFDGGQFNSEKAILTQVERMLTEGASIIDIGGMSSRPGANIVSVDQELKRVMPTLKLMVKQFPEAIISIDTIHSQIARQTVEAGASIVNDISGGNIDAEMIPTIGDLGVPYILMHMKGRPVDMQDGVAYDDVVQEVLNYFVEKIGALRSVGVKDIILDPGFGFAKNLAQNYKLLNQMEVMNIIEHPILAGISRKSMIYKTLDTTADQALNGSTALHMICLQKGAKILRVHDVKEAMECVKLHEQLNA